MMNAQRWKHNEGGIALLLTLGILALLMILAMSFAYTSRTDSMAASVNADMVKSKLFCESALDRAIAMLQFTYDEDQSTTSERFFPATSTDKPLFFPENNRYFMISTGSDPNGVDDAFATNLGFDFIPSGSFGGNGSWQHITEGGDIVGRIAYIVVDESGKLDPNGIITPLERNLAIPSGNYLFDVDNNGSASSVDEGYEERSGRLPQEMDLSMALPSGVTANDFLTGLQDASGTFVPNARWFSWSHIRYGSHLGTIGGMTNNAAALGCTQTLFPHSHDVEAYNLGGTDYHRFDLVSTDWGAFNNSIAGIDTPTPPTPPTATFWDSSREPTTVASPHEPGLPWVGEMVAADPANNTIIRNQVLANLIDYCDGDSYATNNYGTGNSYCGLEKVPYINELLVMAEVVENAAAPTNYELHLEFKIEMANIYPVALPTGAVQLTFDIKDDDALTNETGRKLTFASADIAANSYDVFDDPSETIIKYDMGALDEIDKMTISNIRIVAHAGTEDPVTSATVYDFSILPDLAPVNCIVNIPSFASVWVADPRHNTINTMANTWTVETWPLGAGSTEGGANADPSLSGSGTDTEQMTDPVLGLSTAYIRNAPMRSLWELGAIHRGEAWRTLNIATLKTSETRGTYAYGDALILDQVKLGPDNYAMGKVNANAYHQKVWDAVLGGIRIGGTYENPAGGGALDPADISTLYGAILAANHPGATPPGTPFANRGALASVVALSDGTGGTQDTDRKKEEIIGKIANLLTVRQNYFTIIAVGQAVQDLKTVDLSTEANVASYDNNTNFCRILAEQKIMATVYRDAFTNRFRIERYEFLED